MIPKAIQALKKCYNSTFQLINQLIRDNGNKCKHTFTNVIKLMTIIYFL